MKSQTPSSLLPNSTQPKNKTSKYQLDNYSSTDTLNTSTFPQFLQVDQDQLNSVVVQFTE